MWHGLAKIGRSAAVKWHRIHVQPTKKILTFFAKTSVVIEKPLEYVNEENDKQKKK